MSQPLEAQNLLPGEDRFAVPVPEPASAGDRFLASLLDAFIGGAPAFIPVVGWIWAFLYFWTKDALPFLHGQSVGKKVIGIRVVSAETGKPIKGDYSAALTRQLSLFIPVFGFFDALMVLSSDRRRMGDKWAKTIVVKNTPLLDEEARA